MSRVSQPANELSATTGPNAAGITLDIDWAPDFVIDRVAEAFLEHQVPATWFVTHASPAVDRLRREPELFELGIHPNFLSGSTHGDTIPAVLDHCMQLVPDATSMRTHSLYQSTPMLSAVAQQTPITVDVSLFLPGATGLRPIEHWFAHRPLVRVPFFWEDDVAMQRHQTRLEPQALLSHGDGLKVFNFHPIHVYLNSTDMAAYQALKKQCPRLSETTASQVDPFIQPGEGTGRFFNSLLADLSQRTVSLIRDFADSVDPIVDIRESRTAA